MNKRYYEHTLPIIRGSLSNTYVLRAFRERYVYISTGPDLIPVPE